jgi:hypothetical protein
MIVYLHVWEGLPVYIVSLLLKNPPYSCEDPPHTEFPSSFHVSLASSVARNLLSSNDNTVPRDQSTVNLLPNNVSRHHPRSRAVYQ